MSRYKRLFTAEFIAVLLVSCMAFVAGELLTPVLPLFAEEAGLDASTIGVLFSIMMVGVAISEVFWGWLVDRIDLKLAIFIGTVLYGLVILSFRFITTLPLFAPLFFIYGFCRSPIFIVGRWFVSIYAPDDMKTMAVSILFAASGIVETIGAFASGYIVRAGGFHLLFYTASTITISAGLGIVLMGRRLDFQKHRSEVKKSPGRTSPPPEIRLEDKHVTLFIGFIGTLYFICFGIFSTYVPLFASQVVQANTIEITRLFGIRSLITTLTMIPLGQLADRKGAWGFMPLGMFIVAVSMLTIATSESYAWLLLGSILFALGSSIYHPIGTAILSKIIPVHWTGTAMGLYGLMEDIGWMLGPLIGGYLWEYAGSWSPFVFAAFMAGCSIPILFFWSRKKRLVLLNG